MPSCKELPRDYAEVNHMTYLSVGLIRLGF